ncbi:hypothetical protein TNCV_430471 [Trichonephila clavipes]|nr:hypothetical protein TNCV_430471 [Trichonephila clavipes]
MDIYNREERLIDANINPLSPVKDLLAPFNQGDDLIDSFFSDLKKDNSLSTTVQVPPLSRMSSREVDWMGKRGGTPLITPRAFSFKIVLSTVWSLKLCLTKSVQLTPCHEEFHGPWSDVTVHQTA